MKKIATFIMMAFLLITGISNADAVLLYGTENNIVTHANIWEFDTATCVPSLVLSHSLAVQPGFNVNGNALDFLNDRFYFAGFSGPVPSPLYFSDSVNVFAAGTLDGGAACATFYSGKYYYVKNVTDDLMEVQLDADGYKVGETKIADITGDTKPFQFGDIVYDVDGTLYGYGKNPAAGGAPEFFIFNPSHSTPYESFPQSLLIQLTFGVDGVLYGHDSDNGTFFTVDKTNGDLTQICTSYSPVIKLADLAGFPPEGVVPIPVPVDVKPPSCPNPLSGGGALPIAILGTNDIDVTMIDPQTVQVEGVSPLRWNFGYAAAPYEPYIGKETCDECTTENDGHVDLIFKFDKSAIIAALGSVQYGECRVLHLTGALFNGTPIFGEDVVVVRTR